MGHDYDKILMRMTIILQRLYEGEVLNVSELAKEFNVSTKTIQRDFNERLCRLPIEKVGRNWQMQAGARIERARKADEELVLDLLETIAGGIGGSAASLASSLLGRLKNHRVSAVDSKTVIEDIMDRQHLFIGIEQAIERCKTVSFAYKGRRRLVRPCKIVAFEGYWYLFGEEIPSAKLKTFHLKSIEALRAENEDGACTERAETVLSRAANVWFEAENEPFEVLLYAAGPVAKYFRRRPVAPTQRIVHTYPDGSIDLAMTATCAREVLHEIKKWVPNLVVRSPDWLAAETRQMAQAFLDAQKKIMNKNGHDVVSRSLYTSVKREGDGTVE